ncbi:MAG: hypothetical protein HY258_08090, partial [Chloroflexi bacterium]|nr:hypothetical protein [Chloroflexota bacterium]
MDILLITLIIFTAIVALGYPLVNSRRYKFSGALSNGESQLENLLAERTKVYDAIRDLQFDHMTNKLSDSDYQSLRGQYDARAAKILQQMDTLEGTKTAPSKNKSCPNCHHRIEP